LLQGDVVRRLKEEKAPENDILVAISELKVAKKVLDDKVLYCFVLMLFWSW